MPDTLPELPELPDRETARKAKHMRPRRERRPLPRWVRALARAGKWLAVFVLGTTVLFLGLLLAVQLNAERLTSYALDRLARESSVKISFRDAGIHLVPWPGLLLEDVEVHPTDGLTFRAKGLIVAPNLLSLLRMRFEPEKVIVAEPTQYATLDESIGTLLAGLGAGVPGAAGAGGGAPVDDLLPLHCSVDVHDGQLQLVDGDGAWIRLMGLEARLFCRNLPLTAFDRVEGEVRLASLDVSTPDFAGSLRDFAVSGGCSPHDPAGTLKAGLELRGAMTPMGLAASVEASVEAGDGAPTVAWRTQGTFAFDGAVIPWALDGRVAEGGAGDRTWSDVIPADVPKEQLLDFRLDRLVLGDDRLHLDGLLRADLNDPAVYGRLFIGHASLTRWLDFARGLSPGLQLALDDITNGYIDFAIDKRSLTCPRVQARSSGSLFAGRGGVADWSHPVVFLDMTSDFVDLGRAIPEAVGAMKPAPDFGHKCLTSMTMADIFPSADAAPAEGPAAAGTKQGDGAAAGAGGAPAAKRARDRAGVPAKDGAAAGSAAAQEDGLDIGYDIRLGAKRIHYGYIDLSDGGVIITPGVNSRGQKSAKLSMKSTLYGGRCWGDAFFSGETETEYEFAINTKDVVLTGLQKAMPFILVNKGVGQCQVRVRSRGSEIGRFLANLQGTITLGVVRAAMENDKYFSPFRADVTLALASAAFRNSALGLKGRWDVDYHASDWSAAGRLQGQIWFGGEGDRAGVRFDGMDADVSGRDMERLLTFCRDKNIPLSLKGKAFCDSSRLLFGAKDARLEAPGLSCQGDIAVKKEGRLVSFTGDLAKGSVNVPRFAQVLTGKSPDVPAMLKDLEFTDTQVTASESGVKLSRLHTRVDGAAVSGSVSARNFSATPAIAFNLRCGEVNLDRHLGKSTKKAKAKKPKERPQTLTAGDAAPKQKSAPAPKKDAPVWDFSWVKNYQASGTLTVDSLLVRQVRLRSLKLPVTLEGGHLTVNGVLGTLYGGALAASASVRFDRGVSFTSRLTASQFDLGTLLRDRGTKGVFKAKPDLTAELSSSMTGPDQLTRHLNGSISVTSGRGSYQGTDGDGRPEGRVTRFERGRMTGIIRNGVLHMNDFSLTGEELTLVGEGDFDLANETMDADFEADLPGLPTVPLRLHGSFDNPKTSIGGMVIINAIGGLFKGVFNFVGDIFGGIFH